MAPSALRHSLFLRNNPRPTLPSKLGSLLSGEPRQGTLLLSARLGKGERVEVEPLICGVNDIYVTKSVIP